MTTNNGTAEETTTELHTNGTSPPGHDDNGYVRSVNINTEMQTAYLDYAMSVIVSRALPDVRDGLKPVHRRILYAMYRDLGLTADKPYKKSARIVGEVLGKYHPHGDSAVYDAMVRMAQDFSLRYPLVDGQGNFGSIDGDNAAAMRYTEARLARISDLMLTDLEKDTVDWHDNFDNSLQEPDILPAALPNLLINGSSGIAVGMATNIPPHNLSEVVDALAYMIDHYDQADEITVEQLMQFIKGPDFPTGGILYRYRKGKKDEEDVDAIAQGYAMGRARLILQAKAHFEEMSRNRKRIVVTELPYQTNKTALIERIASLVRDGKIEGVTDLRDESDRAGMRIAIELTRNVDPKRILELLFKYTPLQQTFGMQMLALVDGEPRTLSLKRLLHLFIQHREVIIRRRSEFELNRARERAHIVEGLLRALDILDEVIATIRRSQRVDTARTNLMKNFGFTQVQAQAILDMQLRRLAALERKKLQEEYNELRKRIAYLEDLLAHPEKILAVIKQNLLEIKEQYGDARRTQLVERTKGTLTSTDLLPDQDVWVSLSAKGELRRLDVTTVSATTSRQAGKNASLELITANTRDMLYLFDQKGQCRRASIHEIPQNGASRHLADLTEFSRRDRITAAIALPRESSSADGYLVLVTKQGLVKRITLADFYAAAATDPVVINVESGDELGWVLRTDGTEELLLVSDAGRSIRFREEDVRSMGLAAGGVGGMKLKKGQQIVYAGLVDPAGELMTITANGYAKRTTLEEYSTQGRNGQGIVTHKPSKRTGDVTAALVLPESALLNSDGEWVIVVPTRGTAQPVALTDIPQMGRGVQGKQVVAVSMGAEVVRLQRLTLPPEPSPTNQDDDVGGESAARAQRKSKTTTSRSRKATPVAGPAPPGGGRKKPAARAKSTTKARTASTSRKGSTSKKQATAAKASAAKSKSQSSRKKSTTRSSTASAQSGSATRSSTRTKRKSTSSASADTAAKKASISAASKQKAATATKATKSSTRRTVDASAKAPAKSTAKKSTTRTPKASTASGTKRSGSSAKTGDTKSSSRTKTDATAKKSTASRAKRSGSTAKASSKTSSKSSSKSAGGTKTKSTTKKAAASTRETSTAARPKKSGSAAKSTPAAGKTKPRTTKSSSKASSKSSSKSAGGAKQSAAKKSATKSTRQPKKVAAVASVRASQATRAKKQKTSKK